MSMGAVEVPPLSRADIRTFTQDVRRQFGISDPYFPIVPILEFVLPQIDPEFTFVVIEEEEMGDSHGITIPDHNVIQVRQDVYHRALAGEGRDRMTLAHEWGHLLLHRGVGLARTPSAVPLPTFRDSEWQAKAFAGELLISARHLQGCSDSYDLTERFGVSSDAAELQWKIFKKDKLIR